MPTGKYFFFLAFFSMSMFAGVNAHAQIVFGPVIEEASVDVKIRDLMWMNTNFLDKQRRRAEDVVRINFGKQFNQNRRDIALIQRALDAELVEPDDKETLQAFGIILGDVFENEHRKLNWKVYEDELASHAVCVDNTQDCLFPVTMISRRVEAGVIPDVASVFDNALKSIKASLPKLPYSRDKN